MQFDSYKLEVWPIYLTINYRMNDPLCDRTLIKHEVGSVGAYGVEEQILVTTSSGIEIHITVINDGKCRILDQKTESSKDGIRQGAKFGDDP